jgi:hypothetical protein
MREFVLSFAVGWLVANAAMAGEACKTPAACTEVETCGSADHCGRCGHAGPCEKYCKVVCETKEVKKTVWAVHCSDFCAPLPNCGRHGCGCGRCEACEAGANEAAACQSDGKKCDPCASEKDKCIVPPKCGKVREKKTLEKKEITCKVPSYKCVVVYCCAHCGAEQCGDRSAPAATPAPVKPVAPPAAPVPGKTTQYAPQPPVAETALVK